MSTHNPNPSSCSCHLQPGEWGGGTHHFRNMTEERFVQKAMQRYFTSLRGATKHVQSEEDQARREAIALSRHYVGQPVAFEACPAAIELERRRMEQERYGEAAHSISGRRGARVHA